MKVFILLSAMLFPVFLIGQVNESELNPEGIVFPRMDSNMRDALNAIQGQCIYNTDTQSIDCYDGLNWSTDKTDVKFLARVARDYFLPNFTETVIDTFTEEFDSTNSFDNMTGIFTAPVSGIYHFDVKMSFSKDNLDFDNIPVVLRLKVNGNVIKALGQLVDRITLRSNYGEDIDYGTNYVLNAGDQVTVTVNVISGNGSENVKISYNNGSGDSSFSGFLIE